MDMMRDSFAVVVVVVVECSPEGSVVAVVERTADKYIAVGRPMRT